MSVASSMIPAGPTAERKRSMTAREMGVAGPRGAVTKRVSHVRVGLTQPSKGVVVLEPGYRSSHHGKARGWGWLCRSSAHYPPTLSTGVRLEWPISSLEWPWSSAQRRNPLPAQARKREGARFPDRAPFLTNVPLSTLPAFVASSIQYPSRPCSLSSDSKFLARLNNDEPRSAS